MTGIEEHMDTAVATGTRIPAQRYDFSDEDIAWIQEQLGELLRSRAFLTMGDRCAEFETRFAHLTGSRHAIAVSSGTGALEIILRAIGVEGGEVVVPTNTFAATAFAALHAGAVPVFADCGPDLIVDPDDVERRISPATRAVIVVHIGGLVTPAVHRLRELCAAHAVGSALDGQGAGTFGTAAAFSFFSTKVMTTGEGGMITTDDAEIASRARVLKDQAKRAGRNLHDLVGSNWRLSELQAILGLAQLARLPDLLAERKRVAGVYDEAFAGGSDRLRPLVPPPAAQPNWYKYILVSEEEGAVLGSRLKPGSGVTLGGAVYEVPCHQQPVFAAFAPDRLPTAEHLCRHHVCPPIYPSLTDEEARRVAGALLEAAS